ncbi:hypothetical protein [Modestobacter versicolor]|uniref:hypothetical protein n=1 Tax=Modestobacter versicolor TaxID=429133 RepID=UPI0034DF716C
MTGLPAEPAPVTGAPAEPASVVAARQLAEEARLRRSAVRRRPPRPGSTAGAVRGLFAFGAALAVVLTALTWGHGSVACPAIGWGSSVRVELAGDWSAQPVGAVELVCSPSCELPLVLDEVTGEPASLQAGAEPLVWPVLLGEQPGSAVATVRATDGTVLARAASALDFQRVGGTEECGGPLEAIVRVPAP